MLIYNYCFFPQLLSFLHTYHLFTFKLSLSSVKLLSIHSITLSIPPISSLKEDFLMRSDLLQPEQGSSLSCLGPGHSCHFGVSLSPTLVLDRIF